MTTTTESVQTLAFDDVIEAMNNDEPDGSLVFTTDDKCPANVVLPQGWNAGVQDLESMAVLDTAFMVVGTEGYKITKDALLDFTSTMSIQREYMMRTPGPLMQAHLDYWMKTTERQYRFLVKDGVIVAMTRKPTVVPFSNADVLLWIAERMVANGLANDPSELRVDAKNHHDLKYTGVRLIAPNPTAVIDSKRNVDDSDAWSVGIQIHNSLTGFFPLAISGYLFAWQCANGATATHLDIAKYNRRTHGQDLGEVKEWIDLTVDTLLGDLPDEITSVGKLTEIELGSEMSSTLRDVFERLKVPMPARAPIIDNVVDSDDSSAYGLMQAITQAANSDDFHDEIKTRIFHVGGDMPALLGDRCDACHRLPV